MDETTFNLIKTHVADYFNDNHCLVMLKVLFKDYIEPQKLSKITDTIDLLNALYEKSLLSCNDLTLLYNAIKLTGHFALQDKIKATWTSFPDVREIAVTEFTEHRQKLMRFGQQVIQTDVRRIDGLYNNPLKNYKDSWEMIHHLEDKNFIKEDMTDFIARLKQLDLPKAVDALERPIQGPGAAVAPDVIPAKPTTELDEDDFNELLTEVSDWWRDHGNIHMLRVLLSEFTTRDKTITLIEIEKINTTFGLLGLLKASGLLKQTDIDILVEATNLCGLQGVEDAIAKIVKIPNFNVPYKNFSDHRRKLIALGQQMNTDNMLTIGRLKGIRVNEDIDPFWLILKLEMKGTLAEGEKMDKFIEVLTRKGMTKEVEALTKLRDSEVYDDAVADELVDGLKGGQQIKETSTGTSLTRQEFENINSGNEGLHEQPHSAEQPRNQSIQNVLKENWWIVTLVCIILVVVLAIFVVFHQTVAIILNTLGLFITIISFICYIHDKMYKPPTQHEITA